MDKIILAFQSLDYLIEWFSALIAIAGAVIAFRGYAGAGLLIAVGSGMHAIGYYKVMSHEPGEDMSQGGVLVTSLMYPGLLLLTLGICYLSLSLKRRA